MAPIERIIRESLTRKTPRWKTFPDANNPAGRRSGGMNRTCSEALACGLSTQRAHNEVRALIDQAH